MTFVRGKMERPGAQGRGYDSLDVCIGPHQDLGDGEASLLSRDVQSGSAIFVHRRQVGYPIQQFIAGLGSRFNMLLSFKPHRLVCIGWSHDDRAMHILHRRVETYTARWPDQPCSIIGTVVSKTMRGEMYIDLDGAYVTKSHESPADFDVDHSRDSTEARRGYMLVKRAPALCQVPSNEVYL